MDNGLLAEFRGSGLVVAAASSARTPRGIEVSHVEGCFPAHSATHFGLPLPELLNLEWPSEHCVPDQRQLSRGPDLRGERRLSVRVGERRRKRRGHQPQELQQQFEQLFRQRQLRLQLGLLFRAGHRQFHLAVGWPHVPRWEVLLRKLLLQPLSRGHLLLDRPLQRAERHVHPVQRRLQFELQFQRSGNQLELERR